MENTIECPVCRTSCNGTKCLRCGFEVRNYPKSCGPLLANFERQRISEHRKWFEKWQESVEDRQENGENSARSAIYFILNDTHSLSYPIKIYKLAIGRTSFGKARTVPTDGHMLEKVDTHYRIACNEICKYHFIIRCSRRNGVYFYELKVTDPDATVIFKGEVVENGTTKKIEEEERIRFNGFEAWITTGETAIKYESNGKE